MVLYLVPFSQMKELLAHRAAHDKMRHRELEAVEQKTRQDIQEGASKAGTPSLNFPRGNNEASGVPDLTNKRSVQAENSSSLPSAKRPKASTTAQNFLGIGAKKAKEARSARTAARVGVERANKKNKTAHTGSGVPFPQVIRLKYVKGFTQAVRTPCRLDDLA
jgi:chromosome transmission fidelity protein 18